MDEKLAGVRALVDGLMNGRHALASFPLNLRVLRDQICTTCGPKVNCVIQVDF